MRRLIALALVLALAAPAGAAPKYKRLGEDPALDAPPALDIVYLDVARVKKSIDIRIGINGMLPTTGGYPVVPGIEWTFTTGRRTFIAEAVSGPPRPLFLLFEEMDDGSFRQLENPTGTYDAADGFISIVVPLKTIGATRGTKLEGVPLETSSGDEGDVDAHMHIGPMTHYADVMMTERAFRVP